MRVWAVTLVLDDETVHGATVQAQTAADAGKVLGDRLRADAGLGPDDQLGIAHLDVRVLPDELRSLAINRDGKYPGPQR